MSLIMDGALFLWHIPICLTPGRAYTNLFTFPAVRPSVPGTIISERNQAT